MRSSRASAVILIMVVTIPWTMASIWPHDRSIALALPPLGQVAG